MAFRPDFIVDEPNNIKTFNYASKYPVKPNKPIKLN